MESPHVPRQKYVEGTPAHNPKWRAGVCYLNFFKKPTFLNFYTVLTWIFAENSVNKVVLIVAIG
jgi:hypothetical protein